MADPEPAFEPDPHLELMVARRDLIDSLLSWSGAPVKVQHKVGRFERAVVRLEDMTAQAAMQDKSEP
jgi:hypothetical protein